jgi:hypothetical protein
LPLGIILCVHPTRERPHLLRVGGRRGVGSRFGSGGWLRFSGYVVGGKCVTFRHQLRVVVADEVPVRVMFVASLEWRGRLRVG